jgi:hypothetical protein
MQYREAVETFNGKNCILCSPSWGCYYCENIKITKEDRQKWKACGFVKSIVSLPIRDLPPFSVGKQLSVSNGNIEICNETIAPYEEALCLLFKRQMEQIKFDRGQLESGKEMPSKWFNLSLLELYELQLKSQVEKSIKRGLIKNFTF